MWSRNTACLIRVGICALPIGGLLVLVGMLSNLGSPDPGNDPTGAAQAASTTGYFLAQFVGNVLGPTLVIFGLFAPFAYLWNTSASSLALLGICMILSFLGSVVYAIPASAHEYLNGQQNSIQTGNEFRYLSLCLKTVKHDLEVLG